MELIEYLQYPWLIRAAVASVTVGISCGLLGVFIVLRNMALIGDALAHAILPGVVIAFLAFGTYHLSGFFLGAIIAGLIAAVLITWIQQNLPTKNDAAIGITFTFMFALGVTGISILSRKEGVHLDLNDFLFGNVLGISQEDLLLNALILVAILLSMIVFYRFFYLTTFQEKFAKTIGVNTSLVHYYLMLLLAFTVVASLQTVGVILVVAMLISPASAAILWSDSLKKILFLSALLGAIAAIAGLILAIIIEIPPGPTMAIFAFLIYILSAFFAPEKGVIAKYFEKRYHQNKIIQEDILKLKFKESKIDQLHTDQIARHLGLKTQKLNTVLKKMNRNKLIETRGLEKGSFNLTEKGKKRGGLMVRAHRLWESWLVNKAGLRDDQIHQDAEIYEHLLDEDLIDHLDSLLGFPHQDPHGQSIPRFFLIEKINPDQIQTGDVVFIHKLKTKDLKLTNDALPQQLMNYKLRVKSLGDGEIILQRPGENKTYTIALLDLGEISRLKSNQI